MALTFSRVVETPLDCTTDAFFKFFTEEANKLRSVCGSVVTNIELADGNQSWVDVVGSRKWISVKAPDAPIDSAEQIKDEVVLKESRPRKIIFSVVEGRILELYEFLKVTLEFTSGNKAKWTIDYKKRSELSPDLDAHLSHLSYVSKAVNTHLQHVHASG